MNGDGRDKESTLERLIRKDVSDKVTFEQRLKLPEGTRHVPGGRKYRQC